MDCEVTLVIPARDAAATLPSCLDSAMPLLQQGDLCEIVLVDDGSRDATAAIARERGVRVIAGKGEGPGAARNLGWRAATTPLVWFVDSDCVIEPDALPRLLELIDDPDDPNVGGAGGSYSNQLPDCLLASIIHEEIRARHDRSPVEVDFLGTFNALYRCEALAKVNGFDESLRTAEDLELALRVVDAGYGLRFDGEARVGHFHPDQLVPYLRTQAQHGYWRARVYFRRPERALGDSYTHLSDHIQGPLALLALASVPLLFFGTTRVLAAAAPIALLAMQVRGAVDLVRRSQRSEFAAFAALGFVRSIARSLGMATGLLHALRTTSRSPAAAARAGEGGA